MLSKGQLNNKENLTYFVNSELVSDEGAAFIAPIQTLNYVGIPVPETEVNESDVGGGGGAGDETGNFALEKLGLAPWSRQTRRVSTVQMSRKAIGKWVTLEMDSSPTTSCGSPVRGHSTSLTWFTTLPRELDRTSEVAEWQFSLRWLPRSWVFLYRTNDGMILTRTLLSLAAIRTVKKTPHPTTLFSVINPD